jgi:hypothetical protein
MTMSAKSAPADIDAPSGGILNYRIVTTPSDLLTI